MTRIRDLRLSGDPALDVPKDTNVIDFRSAVDGLTSRERRMDPNKFDNHLRAGRIPGVSYGFTPCTSCGKDVNDLMVERTGKCPVCSAPMS